MGLPRLRLLGWRTVSLRPTTISSKLVSIILPRLVAPPNPVSSECTKKRCESTRKIVSRLQVENTRLKAQNIRLAEHLDEARADSIHYQRAFQMQETDIQKLKVQINGIKESLEPGTLVQVRFPSTTATISNILTFCYFSLLRVTIPFGDLEKWR
jgi:hypothetical protein